MMGIMEFFCSIDPVIAGVIAGAILGGVIYLIAIIGNKGGNKGDSGNPNNSNWETIRSHGEEWICFGGGCF